MENLVHWGAQAGLKAWSSFLSNWIFLLTSALIGTLLHFTLNAVKGSIWIRRHSRWGILGATLVAVATPLCSCGTMAVVLGMLASRLPWAPIIAFMTASPLTSPQELVYSAGLFGWPFALAFFSASIILGLLAGLAAAVLEKRGLLANQARWPEQKEQEPEASGPAAGPWFRIGREFGRNTARLLYLFFAFAFLGYLINGMIPAGWVPALFGRRAAHGVFAGATLGLPLYVNSETSLPLVRTMLDAGMSPGAALAFLIAGAGTSLGAITRALVLSFLWLGAIVSGILLNLIAS